MKREVYKRTSVNSTRFKQKNQNESRHARLCNKRGVIYGMQRWEVVASNIPFKISKWDRHKLWNLQQGDVGSKKRIRKLETSIGRHKVQVWGLDRL